MERDAEAPALTTRDQNADADSFAPRNRSRSNLLVYALSLLILVYVGRIQELFPFLIGAGLGKISVVLGVFLYLKSEQKAGVRELAAVPQVKYFFAIYLLAVLSIPSSVWPGQSFDFTFRGLAKQMLFIFVYLSLVISFDDLKKATWAFILSGGLLALFTATSARAGRAAASATYDPNDIALVMVTSLPLVYFMSTAERGFKKIVLLGVVLVMLAAMVGTVSRGGFLGLLAVAALIFVRDERSRWVKTAVVAFLAVVFSFMASESYWDRMSTLTDVEEDYNMTARSGRKEVWKRGVGMVLENPLLGVGAGAFVTAEGMSHIEQGGKWSAPHNTFLQIGAELGIGGLALFLALIGKSLLDLRRMRANVSGDEEKKEKYLWMINGLEISIYGFCVSGFFLSHAYSSILYYVIASAVILKRAIPDADQRVS